MNEKTNGDVIVINDARVAGYLFDTCKFRLDKIKEDRYHPGNTVWVFPYSRVLQREKDKYCNENK